jgi:hypothetical protein
MSHRAEEEWARRIIAASLDAEVEVHDTGAEPAMYDLHITHRNGDNAAAEVVAAADPESIELWRLMNDREDRWQVDGIVGGWNVALDPSARGKRIIAELPGMCRRLENQRLQDIRDSADALYEFAESLGIRSLRQLDTDYPGTIYVTIEQPAERTGGMVPQTGEPLALWLAEYLEGEDREDVRTKLVKSGLTERHAVVFVPSLSIAPYPVMDLLFRDDPPLPEAAPVLPKEISHVWSFSAWSSGVAFHWDPARGWTGFSKF